jgi:hypothetical protein
LKATIHQPDFLPWPGLFNKIANVDCWIVLDHVENNPRDAAFWGRRVKILADGEPRWLSIPLARPAERGRVGVPIREMSISTADPETMHRCLELVRRAYARAPHFDEFQPLIESYFTDPDANLMKRNMRFIQAVLGLLGIEPRIVYSSEFGIETRATQLLVDLLRAVGADAYRCGGGAQGYQQDALFAAANIALEYNNFRQTPYPQPGQAEFVPGLSIIDALFSVGREAVRGWIRNS